MLTVACVKWGTKYSAEYVEKLQSMCRRHVPAHQFVCFTDGPVDGVDCRPLPSDLPTWWSKVGLFKPGMFSGDVLYLDLDVIVTGSLEAMLALLAEDRSVLWAPDDFGYPLTNPRKDLTPPVRKLLGGPGTINSSVMMWHGDAPRAAWDNFTRAKMDEVHGDQNWLTQALWPHTLRLIPSRWASSYKYGGEGVVRVFHGDPKPDRCRSKPLVAQHWK